MNALPATAADHPAIELDGIQCSYGDRVVLDQVSFAVKRAEPFGAP